MDWIADFFVTDEALQQGAIMGNYNYWLVALSIVLAAVAAFFSLHFASVAKHIVRKRYKTIAVLSGSLVMAGGIWSMHFVGMLAYDMGHSVAYDPLLTFLSVIPSVLASYLTLSMLIRPRLTPLQLILSGTLVGAGIGTMHYMGMEAMEMDVVLKYDPSLFILSIVVAVVLAIIALSVRYYISRFWHNITENWINAISSMIMGFAISGMHYTGMTGARYIIDEHDMIDHSLHHGNSADSSYLSIVVAIVTLLLSILATNITSQLRYRQLLSEKTASELRLNTTLDTAVDGIITINHQGIIQAFNHAAETIFGYQQQEVLNKNISMLMPKPYQDAHDGYLDLYQKTGNKTVIGSDQEVFALHKDGHTFPIRLGVGQVDIEGEPPIFVGFVTDITQRREMEEKIRKSEEQYSSLIKNIPGASFRSLMDDTSTVLFLSDAIVELSGWQVADFYSHKMSLFDLVHPEDYDRVSEVMQQAMKECRSYTVEYRLVHKDGHHIWVLENGSVVPNEENSSNWVDGVILDISSRIKMEEDLRQAKNRAEESAESKAAFLANMSHEIRTPMNAIIGFSDILLESDMSMENKKHLSTISKSARSLLHLLNDILDSAKLDKNKLEIDYQPFQMVPLIDSIISTLWLQAKTKGIQLNFTIDNAIASTYLGAEHRIRQVLLNLIGNAVKFTEHGHVTLTVSKQPSQSIRFAIEDTGIGIPEDRLSSIFESFTQADASMSRRFGGTGLGTTISQQLVQLMGGQIHATSQVGVGSCFYFDLPLEERDAPAQKKPSSISVIPPKRVLLADDIEQNLTLLSLLLKRQKHEIYLANDGLEAVEQYKSFKPDIILMDVQMPNMDGLTATQVIRLYEKENNLPTTPIIALTASVLLEDQLDAQNAGMTGFASKPIDMNELTAEMARVLGVEQSFSCAETEAQEDEDLGRKQVSFNKGLSLWGDEKLYMRELKHFAKQHENLAPNIAKLTKSQDFADIGRLAHAARGAASNLALIELSNTLAAIETSAQTGDAENNSALLEKLSQDFSGFKKELSLLAEKYPEQDNTDEIEAPSISVQELHDITLELIQLTTAGEIDDDRTEYLVQQAPSSLKGLAVEVQNAITDFDFTEAINLLEKLSEALKDKA